MARLQLKRIYDPASGDDGYRVLVDRLWPRGVSKERAQLDGWLKDVAPSPELRAWFSHDPLKMEEFKLRYLDELMHNPATAELARLEHEHKRITLLYAAKSPTVNHAVVLREFLQEGMERPNEGAGKA